MYTLQCWCYTANTLYSQLNPIDKRQNRMTWGLGELGTRPQSKLLFLFALSHRVYGKRDYERLVEHVMTSNEPGQKGRIFFGKYDDIFFLA